MPCQSYDTNWANDYDDRKLRELKKETDKLARIACAALSELEKEGKADFLILKNDELREWWTAHKEADRKEQARLAEIERKRLIKKEALARLSDEEKEVLGLTKTKKSVAKKKPDNAVEVTDFTRQVEKILHQKWANQFDVWEEDEYGHKEEGEDY